MLVKSSFVAYTDLLSKGVAPRNNTYVWWYDEDLGRWQWGLLYKPTGPSETVQVRPRGKGEIRSLLADQVFLLDQPLGADQALMMGLSNPSFRGACEKMHKHLIAQRRAHSGIHALSDAHIHFLFHQISLVARVLSDPVQRYLLTDEVGLGKTIEAGIIIRQRLLEDPELMVVLTVPEGIRHQWEDELQERFHLRGGVDFHLTTHEGFQDLRLPAPGLLVIDEAHLLWQGTLSFASSMMDYAKRATSLLLLSATPVSSKSDDFFRLVQLLCPNAAFSTNRSLFDYLVNNKEKIEYQVLSIKDDMPGFMIEDTAEELQGLVAKEPTLESFIQEALNHAKFSKENEERRRSLSRLRVAFMELALPTKRVVGERRKALNTHLIPEERPWPVEILPRAIEGTEEIGRELESWRWAAVENSQESPLLGNLFATIYATFVESAWRHPAPLMEMIQGRLSRQLPRRVWLDDDRKRALRCPLFEGEEHLLRSLLAACEQAIRKTPSKKWFETIIDTCQTLSGKTVLFVHSKLLGRILRDQMIQFMELKEDQVLLAEGPEDLRIFRKEDDLQFLIIPPDFQNGANLQFAEVAIHVDLPWDIHLMEQRQGRIDRLTRILSLEVKVAFSSLSPHCSVVTPWYNLLKDGFCVFSHSISDVLQRAAGLAKEAILAQFSKRGDALWDMSDQVRKECDAAAQRREGEKQLAKGLDSLSIAPPAEEMEERLYAWEDSFEDKILPLWTKLSKTLSGLELQDESSETLEYKAGYASKFVNVLEGFEIQDQCRSLSRQRVTVASHPSKDRLFRPGEPLFEYSVGNALLWPDGKASAHWVVDPEFEGERPEVYVRVFMVMEWPLPSAGPRGGRRLSDSFLAPKSFVTWLRGESLVTCERPNLRREGARVLPFDELRRSQSILPGGSLSALAPLIMDTSKRTGVEQHAQAIQKARQKAIRWKEEADLISKMQRVESSYDLDKLETWKKFFPESDGDFFTVANLAIYIIWRDRHYLG